MEAIALIGLAASVGMLVEAWPGLPEKVPTHFDSAGVPTDWGSRWTLLLLPGACAFLYTLLSLVRLLPLRFYNIPWRLTPQNAARQHQLARTLLTTLKAEIVWLFAVLELEMIRSATGSAPRLESILLIVGLCVVAATVGFYFYRSYLAR